jgi:hypothetical protein
MTTKMHGTWRTAENISGDIEYFTCYTLVDITDSGIYDPNQGSEYEQAQNLNSLLQAISLSSQPVLSSVEKLTAADINEFDFGSDFTGSHNIWILRFASERIGTITVNNLVRDVDGLPIYEDLDETAVFDTNVFETVSAEQKNIYFLRNDNL